jgi:hypothetical protein
LVVRKALVLLLSIALLGCGGSSGGSSGAVRVKQEVQEIINEDGYRVSIFGCLINERNCVDADVDLNAPVIWAADNGIKIVHIRWAKCADEYALKYAYERGVTVICLAGSGGREIIENSQYSITVGSESEFVNYGPGVDYVLFKKGSIHSGIYATAVVSLGEELKDRSQWAYRRGSELWSYPPRAREQPKVSDEVVLIVDNGFDSVRPLYVMHKNPALAGKITGDYGIKAINELHNWVKVDVIGYVPFNTLPEEPRIDGWKVLAN